MHTAASRQKEAAYKGIYNRFVKRGLDICISGVAILILWPFYLIIALLIAAEDGIPVLYRAERGGYRGKTFRICKFRSMVKNADQIGGGTTSLRDPRITRVGKFIRMTRLDELPQLFNILKGDMSFVGPRPERPEIAKQYENDMPEFALRLQVKAGLTGYAQVYGKYNTPPYDKVQMDLMYIANQSLFEDLRLMLMTFKIVFIPSSTEGVDSTQTTAKRQNDGNEE